MDFKNGDLTWETDKLPVLIQKWDDYMKHDLEYHAKVDYALREIMDKLEVLRAGQILIDSKVLILPCPVHKNEIDGVKSQMTTIWCFIVAIVGAIVGVWFKK